MLNTKVKGFTITGRNSLSSTLFIWSYPALFLLGRDFISLFTSHSFVGFRKILAAFLFILFSYAVMGFLDDSIFFANFNPNSSK